MSESRAAGFFNSSFQSIATIVIRQVKLPSLLRAVVESAIFSGIFLAAGYISLGVDIFDLLMMMIPVVLIMMLSMVASGVYRPEISHSIINIYLHSAYGFVIGSIAFVAYVHLFAPQFATLKFEFFFLFFSFFVINTVRPLISGTDFMDGGGRRTN